MDNGLLLIYMGIRIAARWRELGYAQEYLADQISVSVQMISSLELGKKQSALILAQVESGSVITEKVLVEWVKQITGINTLGINWKEFPYPNLRDESIPFHRFLTSKGLVEEYYKDQLVKEGHEVVPTKTTNWRVVDYKETMVDVEKLILPVDAIGYEGTFWKTFGKMSKKL